MLLQAPPTAELITTAQVLSIVANIIKILEGIVIGFGAFQIWVNRNERREAEARASALARKAANYQAWQVVNGAHGKGGSGGRIDALQDLVANGVSLAGVRLDAAWLEGIVLPTAHLPQSSLRDANLVGANLTDASLERADLRGARLDGANLRGVFLRAANVAGASLATADLTGADLKDLEGWQEIASIGYANLQGVRNPPPGFLDWALRQGAMDGEAHLSHTMSQGFSTSFRAV
jgi:hypothetical protein